MKRKVKSTILIVDDNEDIRFTLNEVCSFGGYAVLEASTGKMGVDVCKKMEPDLILLDYHMPNWDGLKTTKEIRKFNDKTPIIILTVDERQEVANMFLHAGATDFALKPFRAPDLLSRIRINLKIGRLTANQESVFVEKGINQGTLMSIKNFLLQQGTARTINEIQEELPIAYQTVHRYLNYLEGKGEVEIICHYGKKGRPKNLYKLV